MASAETKLVSRIVLRAAVFISLSATFVLWVPYNGLGRPQLHPGKDEFRNLTLKPFPTLIPLKPTSRKKSVLVSGDGRRCYWCGPLAEQVHRSQRAPPCADTTTHITVCDPGFPHCATVATSPPYMESRYCVKFYQDECYSLYCNSTKTWRMTCPCRGDMCNGPNTEREHEAFAVLSKLVSRTNNARVKRALISEFIPDTEIKNATVGEMNINSLVNDTVIVPVELVATQSSANETNALTNEVVNNNTDDEMQSDQPANNIDTHDPKTESTTKTEDLSRTTTESVKDGINNVNEIKTDIQTTTKEITKQTENNDTTPTIATGLSKNVTKSADKVKQTNPLPTPEMRQHDQTAVDKLNGKTVNPTMKSHNNGESTKASMRANNTATRIDTHLITVAIGIILQY